VEATVKTLFAILALATATSLTAHAATKTLCPPTPAASQATTTTAPSAPSEQLAKVGPVAQEKQDAVAVPQVAVPLKPGVPEMNSLKLGKESGKPSGKVDDAAARCQAARP
jgi:hypothetical protein